ncbi:hypothetical protein [Novipirellula herctigrandis]
MRIVVLMILLTCGCQREAVDRQNGRTLSIVDLPAPKATDNLATLQSLDLQLEDDQSPWAHDESKIEQLVGQRLCDLVSFDAITRCERIGNEQDVPGLRYAQLTDDLIHRIFHDGRIVPAEEMNYHLQAGQYPYLKAFTDDGVYRIWVYYEPVGQIVFPDRSSYFFLIDTTKSGE